MSKFFILDCGEESVAFSAHLHFVSSEDFGGETMELAEAIHFLDVLTEERNDPVEDVDVEAGKAADLMLRPSFLRNL